MALVPFAANALSALGGSALTRTLALEGGRYALQAATSGTARRLARSVAQHALSRAYNLAKARSRPRAAPSVSVPSVTSGNVYQSSGSMRIRRRLLRRSTRLRRRFRGLRRRTTRTFRRSRKVAYGRFRVPRIRRPSRRFRRFAQRIAGASHELRYVFAGNFSFPTNPIYIGSQTAMSLTGAAIAGATGRYHYVLWNVYDPSDIDSSALIDSVDQFMGAKIRLRGVRWDVILRNIGLRACRVHIWHLKERKQIDNLRYAKSDHLEDRYGSNAAGGVAPGIFNYYATSADRFFPFGTQSDGFAHPDTKLFRVLQHKSYFLRGSVSGVDTFQANDTMTQPNAQNGNRANFVRTGVTCQYGISGKTISFEYSESAGSRLAAVDRTYQDFILITYHDIAAEQPTEETQDRPILSLTYKKSLQFYDS